MILPRANMPSLAFAAIAAWSRGLVWALVGVLVLVVLVVAQPSRWCGCQSKEDVALAGSRKLAFESYPAWTAIHANAGKCPAAEQLAEYGGSAKDPWGTVYVIDCGRPSELRVSSNGRDKVPGNGDDQRSWE